MNDPFDGVCSCESCQTAVLVAFEIVHDLVEDLDDRIDDVFLINPEAAGFANKFIVLMRDGDGAAPM